MASMQPSRSLVLTLPGPEKPGYMHWHYVCSSVSIATNRYLPFFSVINPTIKLKWLEANWTADEVAAAKKWMLEAVSTTLFFTNELLSTHDSDATDARISVLSPLHVD
jgi:hypothetical protein